MTDEFDLPASKDVMIVGDSVVALIRFEDGKYLVQHRDSFSHIPFPGHWGFFGGRIGENENPETCLRRELLEELNFKPKWLKPYVQIDFRSSPLGIAGHYRYYYLAPLSAHELDQITLTEGAGMKLFSMADLLEMPQVMPHDRYVIWLHLYADGAFEGY